MKTKQVIVVRSDLHMKKGKLAAQVAHASLGAIMQLMSRKIFVDKHSNSVDRYSNNSYSVHYTLSLDEDSPVAHWFKNSFKKVVLVVNSEEELLTIYKRANKIGLPSILITDSGFTAFHGVPTNTCVAIGPWNEEGIDTITGHLKLM